MANVRPKFDRELRASNIRKLKDLGFTYLEIGIIYNVSDVTIYYWLCGDRRSSNPNRDDTYFRKKPKDKKCELCSRKSIKGRPKLQHHHWDNEHPELGIWVCSRCHTAADGIEINPELPKRYANLKRYMIRTYTDYITAKGGDNG